MAVEVKPHPTFPKIYWVILEDKTERLATKNLTPRRSVYGERLARHEGEEYRIWSPFRSKFAAAILKKLQTVTMQLGHKVLYLGAASGTTASHISDIVGEKGHVYTIERFENLANRAEENLRKTGIKNTGTSFLSAAARIRGMASLWF